LENFCGNNDKIIRVVEETALQSYLRSMDTTMENAFICTYLIVNMLERDPALSLFDILLQTFGRCIIEIHRCEKRFKMSILV
jgi:hypothetical protein